MPLLIIVGDQDRLVTGSQQLADQLKSLNFQVEYKLLPGLDHGAIIGAACRMCSSFSTNTPAFAKASAGEPACPPKLWRRRAEMNMEYQEGNVIIDGINIHYDRSGGKKPPIVLLHGATDDGALLGADGATSGTL